MADLPQDMFEPGLPFSNVGVDCFGPWELHARRGELDMLTAKDGP